MSEPLDCLIVGEGPAGLTAATYLTHYRRRILLIDAGESRAPLIPESPLIPAVRASTARRSSRACASRPNATVPICAQAA